MKRFFSILFVFVLSLSLLISSAVPALAEAEAEVAPTLIRPGLAIRAPGVAEVHKEVPLMVVEKHSHRHVAGADVYVVGIDVVKNTISGATNSDHSSLMELYTNAATEHGIFIGTTDEEGRLSYKFEDVGRYLLFAVKSEFTPGFGRISIKDAVPRALHMRNPYKAEVGNPVKIMVREKFSPEHQPVGDVAIYAIQVNANEIKEYVVSADKTNNNQAEKYAILASEKGILLGSTDTNGLLITEFKNAGLYGLVAIKDGYAPDFSRIFIMRVNRKALQVRNPYNARVGQPVTVTVSERLMVKPQPVTEASPVTEETSTSTSIIKAEKAKLVAVSNSNVTAATQATTAIQPEKVKPITRQIAVADVAKLKPVPGARVFAINPGDIALNEVDLNVSDVEQSEGVKQFINSIEKRGTFIGTTNERGQVVHKFENTGRFMLIAIKNSYIPGRSKINIVDQMKKALHIRVPSVVKVTQSVTMMVTEKPLIISKPQVKPAPSNDGNVTSATRISRSLQSVLVRAEKRRR